MDAASCGLSSEVELVARAADPAKPTEDVGSSSDQFVIEVSLESPLNQLLSTAVASQHRPSASSGSCIPQLDEFSFSKKLDPQAGKIAARTHRPDTKFLEHLLRGNDATNNTLSQRSEKRPAARHLLKVRAHESRQDMAAQTVSIWFVSVIGKATKKSLRKLDANSDEKLEQDSAGKTQTSEPEEWQVPQSKPVFTDMSSNKNKLSQLLEKC
nr:hypothetical protein BaRGS_023640 [Batillaria attramentaria]